MGYTAFKVISGYLPEHESAEEKIEPPYRPGIMSFSVAQILRHLK